MTEFYCIRKSICTGSSQRSAVSQEAPDAREGKGKRDGATEVVMRFPERTSSRPSVIVVTHRPERLSRR